MASIGVRRDNGHEESTVTDFAPDPLVPDVSTPKLALVEPYLDACGSKRIADPPGGLGILRGIAQEYRMRGLSHRQDHPWGGLLSASVGRSLA